jgi:UDP-N-acetyl-D-mannosaminuronate dehydrogenase
MPSPARISVIGLGYVGLPLAVALARHYDVVGFDIDSLRIEELGKAFDRTGEVESAVLGASSLRLSASPADLGGSDLFIVTVPTPVDAASEPDLSAVMEATRLVAGALRPGAVVVYESTFYPGVTEDICGPALQQASGLACGVDFHLGYSPERINPGDRAHRIEAITKVVAGQSEAVTDLLAEVYGKITQENIFRAASIKTAEAAKVIENAQRDINIAFINEVTKIFGASTTCSRRRGPSGISSTSVRDWSADTVSAWTHFISPTAPGSWGTTRTSSWRDGGPTMAWAATWPSVLQGFCPAVRSLGSSCSGSPSRRTFRISATARSSI